MLGAIRNKSKGWVAYLIVGLITVPFALFGIQDYASRSANTSIAKVDGEDIDINIYYQELNTQQRNLQQQLGAAYTQEIDNTLKQTLLDSLINEKLIENYANSLDIVTLDDEVKSVISELDSSVRQLAGYEPIHVTSGAVRETDRHGDGQASQESYAGDTVDSANADDSAMDDRSDSGPPPRRSKRWQGRAGGRDNINSAEFSVTPYSQDPVDTAKTIDEITEKDLRANKTLLIGRKIKRFFPGFGGSWGMVEGYDVAKDVYKLRYGIDGYTEKLAFEDVLKL